MDLMSKRIAEESDLVAIYMKANGPRLYKWGLTDHELDCFLYTALWHTIQYLDDHPNDDLPEYQRFWRFARQELSKAWKELNHTKGLPGQNLYQMLPFQTKQHGPQRCSADPELLGHGLLLKEKSRFIIQITNPVPKGIVNLFLHLPSCAV